MCVCVCSHVCDLSVWGNTYVYVLCICAYKAYVTSSLILNLIHGARVFQFYSELVDLACLAGQLCIVSSASASCKWDYG